MTSVREILKSKGDNVWSVTPDATVFDALDLMAKKEIGAVLVMDGGNLIGILSERDYARKVALEGRSSKDLAVTEIMSPKVIYVKPDMSTDECMALMIGKRVRHLPVMVDDKLLGIISIGDVVKAVIDDKDFVIDQLVHYITDTPAIDNNHYKSASFKFAW